MSSHPRTFTGAPQVKPDVRPITSGNVRARAPYGHTIDFFPAPEGRGFRPAQELVGPVLPLGFPVVPASRTARRRGSRSYCPGFAMIAQRGPGWHRTPCGAADVLGGVHLGVVGTGGPTASWNTPLLAVPTVLHRTPDGCGRSAWGAVHAATVGPRSRQPGLLDERRTPCWESISTSRVPLSSAASQMRFANRAQTGPFEDTTRPLGAPHDVEAHWNVMSAFERKAAASPDCTELGAASYAETKRSDPTPRMKPGPAPHERDRPRPPVRDGGVSGGNQRRTGAVRPRRQ